MDDKSHFLRPQIFGIMKKKAVHTLYTTMEPKIFSSRIGISKALRLFPDLCLFQILEYDCTWAVIEKVLVEILDTHS